MVKKAKKVVPPKDMDQHNADRKRAQEEGPKEEERMTKAPELTTSEVAEAIGTDPRTLRKFLRSDESGITPVGQGKRYSISSKQVSKLAKKFDVWKAKDEADRAARQAEREAREAEAETETEVEELEVDEVEELEVDEEPEGYTRQELDDMNRDEVYALAQEYQIEGRSSMTKAELVDALAIN